MTRLWPLIDHICHFLLNKYSFKFQHDLNAGYVNTIVNCNTQQADMVKYAINYI